MPWGKGPIAAVSQKKLLAEKRIVNAKAQKLHQLHIKRMLKGGYQFMSGILAWRAIDHFTKKEDLWPTSLMLLLIMDTHEIFYTRDGYMYGIAATQQNLQRLMLYTKRRGLIDCNTAIRNKHYFLTLQGKKLLKEFYQFYKQRTKEIIKSNGKGNLDLIYKLATIKAKGFDKLNDNSQGE